MLAAISLLFVVGCEKQDIAALRSENPVLTGILYAGENPAGIKFFSLGENETTPINDAAIKLRDNLGNETLLQHDENGYTASGFMIAAERSYTLELVHGGKTITGTCNIPPNIVLVNITTDHATVDTTSEGAPLLTVTWNELDNEKYSYALKLENLEQDKTVIPFGVEGGQFDVLYNAPVLNNSVTLFDTDFKYYGQHRLTVFAIERSLESVYFYNSSDIRGLLQSGSDNVSGAHGYFAGASGFSVDMLIQ